MKWFRKWQEYRRRKKIWELMEWSFREKIATNTIIVLDGVCEDCPGPDWCDCDQGIDCD